MERLTNVETPQWATELMYRMLGDKLRQYAQVSNAHLELLPEVTQPVWVMELYVGNQTALAVLEPPSKVENRYFYILYTPVRHHQIIDIKQTYKASIGGYEARIFSNSRQEVCVEWWDI